MAKNKKIDLVALIVFGVLLVSIILVVVGVCIDWTTTTGSSVLGESVEKFKLSDWAEANGKAKDGIDGYGVMAAFAYITLVLTILTAVAFVVSKFVNVKVLKWVVLGIAALTVISAIVLIATTYSFCANYKMDVDIFGINLANAKTSPAAGPWLAAIFGIVGGAAGAVGALKK